MLIKKVQQGQTEIYMHTSDRYSFKRCRRKWYLTSPFRLHKRQISTSTMGGVSPHLWFGSAIHYALEDYHGFNRWNSPVGAFMEYVENHDMEERPEQWNDLYTTGIDMLDYYVKWESKYATWRTAWLDNKPLVEVNFALLLEELTHYVHVDHPDEIFISIPGKKSFQKLGTTLRRTDKWLLKNGWSKKEVSYGGTFDRIVEDKYGDWWILDYKTAKSFDTKKLPLDPQISAYCWAAEQWFGREIKGMLYLQIHKSPPKPPKLTQKGVSTDSRQRTTYELYKRALDEWYGSCGDGSYSDKQQEMLDSLKDKQHSNGDEFIRFDFVERTTEHKIHTYHEFIAEGKEMINPNLPLYPNPTIDCSWDCNFREMCIAYEEDADWEFYLDLLENREEAINDELPLWRLKMYKNHPEIFKEELIKCSKE